MSRATAVAVLVVAALLAGTAAAVDWLVPDPGPLAVPAAVPRDPATAGSWYCPPTAEAAETAVLSVAAVGDTESLVTVVRYPPEGPREDPQVSVAPGTQLDIRLDPGHATFPVSVRWEGGPAAAAWRVAGGDHAAAPCVPRPAALWYVAGLDTAEGARSRLHLFNPFRVDATVRVSFALPEGPVALALTDNIVVPAGAALPLDLQEYQPEQPDLGAVVEVLAGRVVVTGETRFAPRGGTTGPRGRTLLPAVTAPGTEWTFPYARADERAQSWLSILNPGDREAAVELRVADPAPEGGALGESSVPAGGVLRIDLTDVSQSEEFAVSAVVVNEVPVVVTRTSWLRTGDGREGVGASSGVAAATEWALVGAGLGERRGQVLVANPGTEPVQVHVHGGEGTPAEWSDIAVEPNGRVTLSLDDLGLDRAGVAVRVRASAPVVAEIRSHTPAGALRFWTSTGSPEPDWRGPDTRPPLRRDPALWTKPWPGDPG